MTTRRSPWIAGFAAAALASTAAAAADPPQPDADLECLVDIARTKSALAPVDRQRADLAIMYYLGRLTARMSELDVAQRVEDLSPPATEEQAMAIRRRCAADLITSGLFMVPINKALAEAVK